MGGELSAAAPSARAGSQGQGPPGRKQPSGEKPKASRAEAPGPKPPEPSLPGNTRGERWTEEEAGQLDELLRETGERWGSRYRQRVYAFVQANFNSRNPEAVIHSLRRLIQERLKGVSVPMPERWLDAVLNGNGKHPGENGRFEAAESEREAAERKASTPRIGDLIPPSLKGGKSHGRQGNPGGPAG
jgi:hypothetical protein